MCKKSVPSSNFFLVFDNTTHVLDTFTCINTQVGLLWANLKLMKFVKMKTS